MAGMHWARLRVDLEVPLRRGAWYRVHDLGALQTAVEVKASAIQCPRCHGIFEVGWDEPYDGGL